MGSQISQVTPSAPTVGIESYVDELGDLQYDKTCGSARFMKTIRGRHKDGLVIAKIFIKPIANLSLRTFQRQLEKERDALMDVSHALCYSSIMETERAGYLVRQYLGNNLYDRISTRPFLENIEKRWIAFQLLCGLQKCHAVDVHHGDIKTENILVTSWNWVYLSDFASFKPVYLPEDDPANFSFFFDTSLRRVCYVAPERFYSPGEKKKGLLTDAMDIFSLGCVIAELFLEGSPTFTLSQLFSYRRGTFVPDLSRIDDADISSLVRHMINLNPNDRLTASEYLDQWRNRAFPDYFYSFLHEYVQDITEPSVIKLGHHSTAAQYVESDYRVERIYNEFDKIAYFLKFDNPPETESNNISDKLATTEPIPVYLDIPNYHLKRPVSRQTIPQDCGSLIFLTIIVAAVRNTATATSRLHACDLILAFAERLPDEAKLDRCLPYLVALLDDEFVNVRVAAMRSLTQLLTLVETVTPVNENIFPEYIMPKLQKFLSSKEVFVRANYASCISVLAETSLRFLQVSQKVRNQDTQRSLLGDFEVENDILNINGNEAYFEIIRLELVEQFQEHAIALLTDPDSAVKRALLQSISPLCAFFGSQKANDIILSHLITYLNDKDALLRGKFFDAIISLATFVGGNSLEEYIMPLMVQALADTEEFVVEKVLYAFTSLAELGLIKRSNLWDLMNVTVRFAVHPNLWIREGVFSFVAASVKWLSPADIHCIIRPVLSPFVKCDLLEYSETMMLDFSRPPLSRIVYNTAIKWASESRDSNFWRPAKEQRASEVLPILDGNFSIASLHNLSITKSSTLDTGFSEKFHRTDEDKEWFVKLERLGLQKEDLWKLIALREHIWRISKSAKNYKFVSDRRSNLFEPDLNSIIPVNKLDVQLHTYFFDDTRTTIRRQTAKSPISEDTKKKYRVATALMDALKTIDTYQEAASSTGSLRRANFPPHWLNSVEGSPRTMAPIFPVGSPNKAAAINSFLSSPPRQKNDDVSRVKTSDSIASTSGHSVAATSLTESPSRSTASETRRTAMNLMGSLPRNQSMEYLEPQFSGSRELRRRVSSISVINKHELTGKTSPDVGTITAYAYGKVDKPPVTVPDKQRTTKPKQDLRYAMSADGSDGEPAVETVIFRGHSYTGDDPYILKLLDSIYLDRFMEDIPEFGAPIPLSARPRVLLKQGNNRNPGPWKPDGVMIAHFEEHKGAINRIVVSPDHFFFLTASDDGTVKIWDALQLERNATNRSRQTFKHSLGSKVKSLCFIDSTHCFASAATDGKINIVRIEFTPAVGRGIAKYGKLSILRAHQLEVGEWAVWMEHIKVESSSILMIATNKSRILALNLRTMRYDYVLQNPLHHGTPTCFCMDRKRAWIAIGTSRGIIDIWSLRYQVRIKSWGLLAGSSIHRISLHPTRGKGRWICVSGGTCMQGSEITVWDVEKSLCKEVYRTYIDGDNSAKDSDKRYEPRNVDEISSDSLLSRLASDPVQLMERTEISVLKSIRSFCLGAIDFSSALSGDDSSAYQQDSQSQNANGSRNSSGGGFIISVGGDKNMRYWNIGKPENSFVISGPLLNSNQIKYNVTNISQKLVISTETLETGVQSEGEPSNSEASSVLSSAPKNQPSVRVMGGFGSKRRTTLVREPPPAVQIQRQTLVTPSQQKNLTVHVDAILDVALLCRPYGMIISVDRVGSIKIYS
ncbi:hypothetical protein V1511DRAFT_517621 [Dipodascopsis uninucleata]